MLSGAGNHDAGTNCNSGQIGATHPLGDIGPPVDAMQTGYVPYEPKKRELTQKVAQKMPGSSQQPADGFTDV